MEQWIRQCKLTVQINKDQPQALDLSDFRIVFHVAQPTTEQPKSAEIYIYNISHKTMNMLAGENSQNKDTQVILEVGYKSGPLEILFKGTSFQFRKGRDNQVDTWLCILAQSADTVKSFAIVNNSLPAGTSVSDMQDFIVKEYSSNGIDTGEVPTLTGQRYPRGRVFFGSLDRHTSQFCRDNNISFSLDDDIFNAVPFGGYSMLPMQILNKDTGMIGMPQLTSEGLRVTSLINPKFKRNGRVQIDLSNLQTESYDIQYGKQGVDQPFKNQNSATNPQGTFIIVSVEHYGDIRGDEWYSTLICVGVDAVVPKSGLLISGVNG
ncbi:baseplate hub protein [Acinetobacter rathckeae]|uniref:baseplate hub protein n=1 Tax=Acinetobacter rathckeae TaxID=2605272 RepID=UPI0018A32F10|nr:hypothetical protein [Acinetobacter rathckeae]MBF7687088.1 hypothetical protein [Acinetobacter rathckeae]